MPCFAIVDFILVGVVLLGRLHPVSVGHQPAALCSIASGHHYPINAPINGDTMEPLLQTRLPDRMPEAIMTFIRPPPSGKSLGRGAPSYVLVRAQHEDVSASQSDHLQLWHVSVSAGRHIAWHGAIRAPSAGERPSLLLNARVLRSGSDRRRGERREERG